MANAKGKTFTKAELARVKASESKMTPAQRRATSKALVEANTAANAPKTVHKKKKV